MTTHRNDAWSRPRAAAAAATLLGALLATAGVAAHEVKLEHLKIVHPHTMEPAAGVTDVTVSMKIRNSGSEPERLTAASSPLAREALVAGGVDGIAIPAGGSIELTATGPHIRLLGLTEPLTGYEMFPLWLTFAHAGRVEVEVMVEENNDAVTAPPAAATDAAGGSQSPPSHHQQ